MIIHGGFAIKLQGISLDREPSDIDMYGSQSELDLIADVLKDRITVTKTAPNKYFITAKCRVLREGWKSIEFEIVSEELYDALHRLPDNSTYELFDIPVQVASLHTVCSIKDVIIAHANFVHPKHENDLVKLRENSDRFRNLFTRHIIITNPK